MMNCAMCNEYHTVKKYLPNGRKKAMDGRKLAANGNCDYLYALCIKNKLYIVTKINSNFN